MFDKDKGLGLLRTAAFCCLALIAAVWTLTYERIGAESSHAIEDAQRQNSNLALAFEEHVVRTLKGMDQTLLVLQREFAERGRSLDLQAMVRDGTLDSRLATVVAIVDEQGRTVLASLPAENVTVAEREFFQHHRDRADLGLLISPVTVGRVTGRPTIHVSRRIEKRGGAFGGVVFAGIDLRYFTDFYNNLALGPDALVMLMGTDGWLRAMRTTSNPRLDPDLRGSTLFRELQTRASGDYVSRGRLDGQHRYMSYRTVRGYPLVVAVGASQRDVLAGLAQKKREYLGFAAIATFAIVLFGALLLGSARRKLKAEAAALASAEALAEKNERLARQQRALTELANSELLHSMPEEEALRRLTEAAADVLAVERVSYWRLGDAHAAIDCLELFERTPRRHSAGVRLAAADYPAYFAALAQRAVIDAADAHRDARTAEFSAAYLTPLGIGAMLDVPVFVNGRAAGVLCHEHVGAARRWPQDEQLFATAIGSMLSLALERAQRRRAEAEGAAVARRNGALVEALGEVVYDWAPAQDKVIWDGGIERVLGYSRDEFGNTTASWLDRVHPEDLPCVKAEVEAVIKARRNYQLEYRFLHKDGGYRWMRDSGVPHFAADGSLERIVGVFSDITQRKNEERLVEMEHAVTRCLADAGSASEGLECVLATLCQAQGWEGARYYGVDEQAGVLRCEASWSLPEGAHEEFDKTRSMPFARGVGLAGTVWQSGEPMWVPDVRRDARVVDGALTPWAMRSAFLFPVLSQGRIDGVIATFGRQERQPDERLLQAAGAIGAQVGQFVERKRAQERALQLAQFDPVTCLPNRALFRDRLDQALAQAHRNKWRVAVMLIDLDNFKRVNDTLGHAAGDELLKAAAGRFRAVLREGDTVARLGGDEFAVALAEVASAEDAGIVAQKLLDCLGRPLELSHGGQVDASASIGIATYPGDGTDAAHLLRHADLAMYRAKEAGRGRYHFFTAQMNADAERRFTLEQDLRTALPRGEFELHYQPKCVTGGDQLTGVEALLRWRRADGVLVPPAAFIPVLEDMGLIAEVGAWVIGEACRQVAQWHRAGLPLLRVAINVSPRQLRDGAALVQTVRRALDSSGCPAQCLEIEVTESMVMQDLKASVDALKALRAMGLRIAIDDFGTGHSSLAYLKKLPIDAIKIDRSFVKNITEDADELEICTAITRLAHTLGYRVVAEGVETEPQRRLLQLQACDEYQGYLLSRPLPPAELEQWVRARTTVIALAKEVA